MNDQPIRGGAVLYTVQGPRGSYFAVHDPATGRICTESSDPRARAQAREMGLVVTHEETISHQELLRRTGREADGAGLVMKTNPAPATNPEPKAEEARGGGECEAETVVPLKSTFFLDDTAESLIVRHAHGRGAVFSSKPLEPEPRYSELSDDSGLWGNMPVLNPPEEDWTAPEGKA